MNTSAAYTGLTGGLEHALRSVVVRGTFASMNRAYVGIVTRRGLEAIFPENDHVVRFLHRRVYRRRPFAGVCCWAVLSDEMTDQIEWHLEFGENLLALQTLLSEAVQYGSIPPSLE